MKSYGVVGLEKAHKHANFFGENTNLVNCFFFFFGGGGEGERGKDKRSLEISKLVRITLKSIYLPIFSQKNGGFFWGWGMAPYGPNVDTWFDKF